MVVILVLLFVISFTTVFLFIRNHTLRVLSEDVAIPVATVTPTPSLQAATKESRSLFVPYWTLEPQLDTTGYDTLLYFGITPDRGGINRKEPGYMSIAKFTAATSGNTTNHLVLRMVDSEMNFAVLEDKKLAQRVIFDTIKIAKEQGFDGVVLDLEVLAIPFDSVVKNITTFITVFSNEAKKQHVQFGMTLYGDTFYRLRPFDVREIVKHTDYVMIMAYDFHKSRGNPGPNFPLSGKEQYGYDYRNMISQFVEHEQPVNLVVIFGMFGYDWTVDEKGTPITYGTPLTQHQIRERFFPECKFTSCKTQRDSASGEMNITYTDNQNKRHSVWFEDDMSVKAKQKFLKTQGINNFSFWAYSYF